jgi:ABC-type transporter Mla MlaB component
VNGAGCAVDAAVVMTDDDAIMLPSELDRAGVGELRTRIEAMGGGSSITIDGSRIRRVHTPGVQLLCALVLAAEGRGANVAWTAVPPVLVNYVNLLGIGDVLHFHGRIPAALDYFE